MRYSRRIASYLKSSDPGDVVTTETENAVTPTEFHSVGIALKCKRLLDICVATVLGVLSLPFVAIAIVAIKVIDPGPAFFIQDRVGFNGCCFRFFKLRTMRVHSDEWLADYLAQDPTPRDPRIYRDASDPRILPFVGALLRRYSIDELPQIWNVVRGDLSLVGPRALPGYHCKLLDPAFLKLRSRVRPGITGLWQIESRGNADPATIEAYDGKYLSNWSLAGDLRILLRTAACVLRGSGI